MIEAIGSQAVLDALTPVSEVSASKLAPEFEAMVMQGMLKSACIDTHFAATDASPLSIQTIEPLPQWVGAVQQPAATIPEHVRSAEVPTQPPVTPKINDPDGTADDFVKAVWPYIKQASQSLGLDPKLLLAQAALETGWGKFIAKDADGTTSHNLFNIKSIATQAEPSVSVKTTEYIAESPVKMMASFKKYATIEASVNDYLSLITHSTRYKTAVAQAANPARYVAALQEAGYATDPHYANKILSIYQGDELQQALDRVVL